MEESELSIDKEVVPEIEPPEEMVAKSRVNEIVKREKLAAADKVRREMEQLHAQELEKLRNTQAPSTSPESPDIRSTVQQLLSEEIQKFQAEEEKRAKEAQEAELEKQLQQSASNYLMKIEQGKPEFSDFDDVMKDFDVRAFSGVALLAGQMDKTAAIMYELAQNPLKVAQLHTLAQQSPTLAEKEMRKLEASIVKNKQAALNNVQTNAPLSRLKSSTVAGADNGVMGLKDFKKADWLKA